MFDARFIRLYPNNYNGDQDLHKLFNYINTRYWNFHDRFWTFLEKYPDDLLRGYQEEYEFSSIKSRELADEYSRTFGPDGIVQRIIVAYNAVYAFRLRDDEMGNVVGLYERSVEEIWGSLVRMQYIIRKIDLDIAEEFKQDIMSHSEYDRTIARAISHGWHEIIWETRRG